MRKGCLRLYFFLLNQPMGSKCVKVCLITGTFTHIPLYIVYIGKFRKSALPVVLDGMFVNVRIEGCSDRNSSIGVKGTLQLSTSKVKECDTQRQMLGSCQAKFLRRSTF